MICITINLGAFPGLGTILAGRRIGYVQAALMLAGFTLVMGFMIHYIVGVGQAMVAASWNEAEFKSRYQGYLWALYWGLGATVTAWLWAAASSLQIWRESKKDARL